MFVGPPVYQFIFDRTFLAKEAQEEAKEALENYKAKEALVKAKEALVKAKVRRL